jgi:hypothetical protein
MLFSDILGSAVVRGDLWSATVPDEWMQGRSVFGGLQSAMALRAMRGFVPAEVPLRVLQTTFVAPVPAGDVTVRSRVLRSGKSVTHVEATILAGGDPAALIVGVFGRARPSRVEVVPRLPVLPADEVVSPGARPRPPGVAFAQHFPMRWLRGDLPMTGSRRTDAVIEVGMIDAAAVVTEEHVVAIADAIPPLALSLLEAPAFGSSLTWTLEMLTGGLRDLPLAGWQLHVDLTAAKDGYTSQSVVVCGPGGGGAVALSRQSMAIFG